jgi:hypothetical protein
MTSHGSPSEMTCARSQASTAQASIVTKSRGVVPSVNRSGKYCHGPEVGTAKIYLSSVPSVNRSGKHCHDRGLWRYQEILWVPNVNRSGKHCQAALARLISSSVPSVNRSGKHCHLLLVPGHA